MPWMRTRARCISHSADRVGKAHSPVSLLAKPDAADHPGLVCIGLTGFPCYGIFPKYVFFRLMKLTYASKHVFTGQRQDTLGMGF